MRVTLHRVIALLVCLWMNQSIVWAADATVGAPAPEFALMDSNGKTQTLAQRRGHVIVLEWFNPECPFTKKHYVSRNMQRLQSAYTAKGVIWFSMNSSAPGKQGHLTPAQANAFLQQQHATPTAVLLDSNGVVGQRYGAKTTPHLFIINPEGVLIYTGAIDDHPSADPKDVDNAVNYVQQALDEVMSGKSVSMPQTKPYGCTIKYAF